MARINIEDCWWSDIRRSALIRKLQDEERADGAAIRLWKVAFDYWREQKQAVPKQCFDLLPCAQALLECGLAVVENEQVYVRGAEKHFDWYFKKVNAGRQGGKKRAENHKKEAKNVSTDQAPLGSAQAHSSSASECLRVLETPRSTSQANQPTSSSSSSSSSSIKKNTLGEIASPILEELYQLYPKRQGDQRKKAAMGVLQKLVAAGRTEDIRKAITNYAAHCKSEDKVGTAFVQQFKTFMSQTWEEWITPPNGKTHFTDEELKSRPGFSYDPDGRQEKVV